MHISRKVIPSIKLEKETRSVIRMGYPSSKQFCDNFFSHVVLLCSIQRQKRKINHFLHHRALNLNQLLQCTFCLHNEDCCACAFNVLILCTYVHINSFHSHLKNLDDQIPIQRLCLWLIVRC